LSVDYQMIKNRKSQKEEQNNFSRVKIEMTIGENSLISNLGRLLRGQNGANLTLLFTLVLMMFLFSIQSEYFLTVKNILSITRAIAITGVVAAGETIVLIGGGIDLSVASIMAACGMAAAFALRSGYSFGAAILFALIIGTFVGLINGLIITKIRINPLITTLGVGQIVRGITYLSYAGGTLTVPIEGFSELGRGRFLDVIPYSAIVLLAVYIILHLLLTRSLLGRMVYGIGGNPIACRLAGINVDRWRLVFYCIGGLFAGLGGYILTSLSGSAVGGAAIGAELDIISAVILGGASLAGGEGNMIGTFLGALVLGTLSNGLVMMNVPVFWQQVAGGTVLLIALFIDSWRSGGYR
jgi:ribose transport system permease protein